MGPVSVQVLETCVNHCGGKFHSEVAKFRFLNELIKVLSPKVSECWLGPAPARPAATSHSCHPLPSGWLAGAWMQPADCPGFGAADGGDLRGQVTLSSPRPRLLASSGCP